jgi:hypothetical protein
MESMNFPAHRPAFVLRQLAAAALAIAAWQTGCSGKEPADGVPTQPSSIASTAADRPGAPAAKPENPLSADRAFGYLSQLCNLGPRPSGSRGMLRQQAMLSKYFEQHGAKVELQEFFIRHPLSGERVRCANLIVQWNLDAEERVLLCAHYDTRPLPDRDPNPRRRREGVFVGANDGASGVAVLMELAHHLPRASLPVGVDFVLFDAEELVYHDGYRGDIGEYFLGSDHFARQYKANPPAYRYRWGVLLDMVGDAELELLQEKYSMNWPETRPLVLEIWQTASRLGVKEFVPRMKRGREEGFIRDDHLKLRNIARIPTCDIIDAEYPDAPFGAAGSYWHTEQDIPRNCSGESLAKVGWVLLEWLKSSNAVQ